MRPLHVVLSIILALLVIVPGRGVCAGTPAASLFANPFLTPEELIASRGSPSPAKLELYFHVSTILRDGSPSDYDATLIIADDWAYWLKQDGKGFLFDFKAGREISLDTSSHQFSNASLHTLPTFAYWERLNRFAMAEAFTVIGKATAGCDADTELGVEAQGQWKEPPVESDVAIHAEPDALSAVCGSRTIGKITLSDTAAKNPVLWATISRLLQIHPRLVARARKLARLPSRLDSEYVALGNRTITAHWELRRVEALKRPYPLDGRFVNTTASDLSRYIHPVLVRRAEQALGGSYDGGPPDRARWGKRLKDIAKHSEPAALIELGPTIGMFPAVFSDCKKGKRSSICAFFASTKRHWSVEPALKALATITALDVRDPHTPSAALAAMKSAQSSPLASHVVLGAAYAIAMLSAGIDQRNEAERSGLAVNFLERLQAATEAYPYDPLYWLDLSNYLLSVEWNYTAGMAALDIAMSLPMPEAMKGEFVKARREFCAGLVHRLPQFYP